ncbi:uncharacterized protein LOC142178885 [Nicotiana tabacum]|uniref:Uncharacterized protein LOC142178885 n=1 Tax=Nicotiana tabacum TaxID=4097 RepID=A0AC58U5L9_TOBAC
MADKFVTAHAGTKKAKARVNDIFAVKQSPDEGLKDFLARFNKVRMSRPNVSEGMSVEAFQNGLSRNGSRAIRKILSRLMKYTLTTWGEIHNAYCAEVRADEDDLNSLIQRLTSVQAKSRKYRRNNSRRDHSGPRLSRERHHPYVRTVVPPPLLHIEGPRRPHTGTQRNERGMPPFLFAYNFYVSPSEIVYALEKLGTKVKWPQKMKSDPNTRKSNVLCEFHQERGHKTEDCISLRQAVVRMLNQGHLRELMSDRGRAKFTRGREPHQPPKPPSPARTIQMIIGGGDESMINHVKFTTMHKLKRSITHELYNDIGDSIIFDKSDTDDLTFSHFDALVITLHVLDTNVRRIMVNDGSGACIINPRVLAHMRLEDKIIPRCITLTGFNNVVERTSREIMLPVLIRGVTLETIFHIMN